MIRKLTLHAHAQVFWRRSRTLSWTRRRRTLRRRCAQSTPSSRTPGTSVADPGCLSRIPDPDFYPSRIPDPKTATKERGEKKFVVIPFFVATKYTKLKIIIFLKCFEKKLGQFSKNYRTFYSKNCHYALKSMGLDPGSEIRDPGSGKNTHWITWESVFFNIWINIFQHTCEHHKDPLWSRCCEHHRQVPGKEFSRIYPDVSFCSGQCRCGSGSADPYLRSVDPDPALDPRFQTYD